MCAYLDDKLVFYNFKIAKLLLQHAVVSQMTLCVAFGALRLGAQVRNICDRSDYVMFRTISAIAVRVMAVCVAFGALHFNFLIAILEHPRVDQTGGLLLGTGFRDLRF